MLFEKDPEKITQKFSDLFTPNEIPKTGHQNKTYHYFSTDILKNHHTEYPHVIEYNFNEYGYRCSNFERQEKNVMTLGCSIGFGNGIPSNLRFSSVFCNLIGNNVGDWNLSWPGVSCDYVARMAVKCIPILKPDILLVNFPNIARREFFDINGDLFSHRPNRATYSSIESEIHKAFMNLTSQYQDLCNLYMNYMAIKNICKLNGVTLLYSVHEIDFKSAINVVPDQQFFVPALKKVDFARDGGHPGVNSNKIHGEHFFERLKSNEMDIR
jgi:hypothetical protein